MIRVIKTLTETYEIGRKSVIKFWTKEIAKEMTNVCIAFEQLDGIKTNNTRKGKVGLDTRTPI